MKNQLVQTTLLSIWAGRTQLRLHQTLQAIQQYFFPYSCNHPPNDKNTPQPHEKPQNIAKTHKKCAHFVAKAKI